MITDRSFIPGSVCWIDVSSTDPTASQDFYAGLFGWTYQIDPHPGRRQYRTALCAGRPVGGLVGVPVVVNQPMTWTLYLTSANTTHTAQVFRQRGGQVLYGPVNVPGRGSVLVGADPTGGVIGFWQPKSSWMFHTTEPRAAWCSAIPVGSWGPHRRGPYSSRGSAIGPLFGEYS